MQVWLWQGGSAGAPARARESLTGTRVSVAGEWLCPCCCCEGGRGCWPKGTSSPGSTQGHFCHSSVGAAESAAAPLTPGAEKLSHITPQAAILPWVHSVGWVGPGRRCCRLVLWQQTCTMACGFGAGTRRFCYVVRVLGPRLPKLWVTAGSDTTTRGVWDHPRCANVFCWARNISVE
jgi:hypothetical protein